MRIFHGPENIAGIGGHLASYQKAAGHDAAFFVYAKNRFFDNHDGVILPEGVSGRFRIFWYQLRFFFYALRRYDIFTFYFGRTLLPLSLDLPLLRLLGKKVVMVYCGSDIRIIALEKKRNPYWHHFEAALAGTLNDERYDTRKKLRTWYQGCFAHKVLAPRNLYASASLTVPASKLVADVWVHNLSSFGPGGELASLGAGQDKPASVSGPVRIVHIPSSPEIKGTAFLREVIEQLRQEALDFDYVELLNIPHQQALAEISQADIVVDQLLFGGFGSLSVEGMAFGKPVLCYLIPEVQAAHYPDCPIVNVTIDSLQDTLRDLIQNKALREQKGQAGQAFVKQRFDYVAINEKMLDLYREL